MDIKINTYMIIMALISFLLASCITDNQDRNKILGVLYVSDNIFKEKSDEFILTKQDIEMLLEEKDQKYYRINYTSKVANLWWSSWELPKIVGKNIIKYKSSNAGDYEVEVDKLQDSFQSLDKLMRSKYIEDDKLYELINKYCSSTNSVIDATSPFPSVNFVMSMGSQYRFLARFFYESLERPDGTRFENCNL